MTKAKEKPNILTVDSIKDYQMCELLYSYRHKEELYEPIGTRDLMAERYENVIRKVASFFFYKMQGGNIPSYNALLNRWERLWFNDNMTAYDIATEQHETLHGNMASYTTVACAALLKFYEDFEGMMASPLLINEEFVVPIVHKTVRLEGTIDLVLKYPDDKYQVIRWSGRKRRPAAGSLTLDYAAIKYAFEYRNKKKRLDNVTYWMYDLGSSSPGYVSIDIEKRDLQNLFFWSQRITNAKSFPPRRGLTTYCKQCPFDKPCSKYSDY